MLKDIMIIEKQLYFVKIDLGNPYMEIKSKKINKQVIGFGIDIAIDSLSETELITEIAFQSIEEIDAITTISFEVTSSIWQKKIITFIFSDDRIDYYGVIKGDGQRIKDVNYFLTHNQAMNKTDYGQIYLPRFDWFVGEVIISTKENDSLGCQQWLSPPPFCYALLSESDAVYCGVATKIGAYNFLSLDYYGVGGPYFTLTYEGHTVVEESFTTPVFVIGFGEEDPNEAINAYVMHLRDDGYLLKDEVDKMIPKWWYEPIFCSWGQMRYDYREDHDGHENGNFINVTNYSTQALHQHYMNIFDQKDINPGTVIIDMGWAKDPALHKPSEKRWTDMRGFIDQEHKKGRKVLLWYTPVVTQGLPIEACMTLDGRAVAPDPTSPVYQQIIKEEIYKMLSDHEGCLGADGFKIDFTQCTPSEEGRFTSYLESFWALINEDNEKYFYKPLIEREHLIQTYGKQWGVEILKGYIETIYSNMKQVKKDAVLITHTANPYFAEVVDILRLNDLDGDCDNVLGVMKNRAKIAKMCSKNWLIDTDNDLMYDKKRWRDYIELQPTLGIPDTYYVHSIATSGEVFDASDYELLKRVWSVYRKTITI